MHALGTEVEVDPSEFKASLDYIASSKQNKRETNDVNAEKKVHLQGRVPRSGWGIGKRRQEGQPGSSEPLVEPVGMGGPSNQKPLQLQKELSTATYPIN